MKSAPQRVLNIETYWSAPPPERSARCAWWERRISDGWRGNKRTRGMGYYDSAQHFGVYIWEYINVLCPMLGGAGK